MSKISQAHQALIDMNKTTATIKRITIADDNSGGLTRTETSPGTVAGRLFILSASDIPGYVFTTGGEKREQLYGFVYGTGTTLNDSLRAKDILTIDSKQYEVENVYPLSCYGNTFGYIAIVKEIE